MVSALFRGGLCSFSGWSLYISFAHFKRVSRGGLCSFLGGLCSAILKTRLLHRDPPRDHLMLSETISTLTLGEPNIDTACRTKSPVFRGVYSPSFWLGGIRLPPNVKHSTHVFKAISPCASHQRGRRGRHAHTATSTTERSGKGAPERVVNRKEMEIGAPHIKSCPWPQRSIYVTLLKIAKRRMVKPKLFIGKIKLKTWI